MTPIKKEQKPLGLIIFGMANLVVFGALPLVAFATLLLNPSSSFQETFSQELARYFPEISLEGPQVTAIFAAQTVIAAVFCISGLGLILKKEWARKITLGFSFFVVVIAFLAALSNRAMITRAIVQIIYPGALILYFTNTKVAQYFRLSGPRSRKKLDN
ncbi:MAG: hypothetical protein PHU64_01850 [Candidatus Omnitrophica bacterium]|nr:hypothetical protein [Candidatus Omnitrophota bacterium]MDD5430084.1 hypothetical protein [Candidatus Omnitrophota bacterium]